VEYVHAKLMINAVYGRSALAPETEITTMEWDEELGDYNFRTQPDLNEDNDAYLPFGMFVTAQARKRLLTHVKACLLQNPFSVIHCDTDSVIYYGKECEGIDYGEHLGTWGLESEPAVVFEGGFKRYIELSRYPIREMSDIIGMAAAGIPQKKDHNGVPIGMWVELIDDPPLICRTGSTLGQEHYSIKSEWLRRIYEDHGMDPDDVNTLKLIPVKVPGGVILDERQHQLNDNLIWRLRR